MDRCTRCVLPTGYPGLRFDEAGTCEFCRRAEAEPPWSQTLAKRASELEAIVARIRQDAMGASYDCVVPISGGKDSSYVLYYARRVLGLRVLALNFHNGLQAEAAHHNLEILCVDLDVPLVTLRPSTSLMRRMYARFLRETGEFCSVCNGIGYFLILSFGLREATRTRRTIHGFGGWSARYDAEPGVYSFDTSYLEQVLGPELMTELLADPLIEPVCVELLKSLADPRGAAAATQIEASPIHYYMLPDYVPWFGPELQRVLTAETRWRAPADALHFDCRGVPFSSWLERRKYGLSQQDITYSAWIRDGLLSRQQALAALGTETDVEPEGWGEFLAELGLSRTEVRWDGRWHPQRLDSVL